MSYAVVRGEPTKAQLYLDGILDAVREEDRATGGVVRERDQLNVAEVLYYCMRSNPLGVFMIDGSTGEQLTNAQLLDRAIPLARALSALDLKDKFILMTMRNKKHMAAMYYAVLFSGVVPFFMDPNCTLYELRHFMKLVSPALVICDQDRREDIVTALDTLHYAPPIVVADDDDELDKFTAGHSADRGTFRVADVSPDATAVILPTSGSTGLPKAAFLTHKGLVAQLSTFWSHDTHFPTPTKIALYTSTLQWLSNTVMLTTCPVFHITILTTSAHLTAHTYVAMIDKYRPTWVLLVQGVADFITTSATAEQVASLQTVHFGGSVPTSNTMSSLKKLLSSTARLCYTYGLTETQGCATLGTDPGGSTDSVGLITNVFDYKLVSQDGQSFSPYEEGQGELFLKSDRCIFKGYLNNAEAFAECATVDGWWRTGDVFRQDRQGCMYFVERSKFCFKYNQYYISPEELERLISTLPGVQQVVVAETTRGAGAAVVVHSGESVTREQINDLVERSLSDYKKLRGGIAFVDALPLTHSGKIHRMNVKTLLNDLVEQRKCY